MNYFDLLASLAYPMWASLCLVWSAIFLAEYRATRNPMYLLVIAAATAQMFAFSILSVSTGAMVFIPFSKVAPYVRSLAIASSVCAWLYTVMYLWNRWKLYNRST